MTKHKRNHIREGVFICDNTLDFPSLINIYIENSSANKLTRWVQNGSYLK